MRAAVIIIDACVVDVVVVGCFFSLEHLQREGKQVIVMLFYCFVFVQKATTTTTSTTCIAYSQNFIILFI